MIRLRTASALAIGAVAALALGGTALAAGNDDPSPSAPPAVEMLPDGTVVTPSPSATTEDASPSPSASTDDTAPAPSASTSTAAPSPSASSAGAISLDAAKAIAIKAAGGGRVTDVERETEHGRAVWDIEVQRGNVEHDIDVDRTTGDVLRHKSKADDKHNDDHNDDNGDDNHGHGSDD